MLDYLLASYFKSPAWFRFLTLSMSELNQRWWASSAAHEAPQKVLSVWAGVSPAAATMLLAKLLLSSGLAGAESLPGVPDGPKVALLGLEVSESSLPLLELTCLGGCCTVTVTLNGLLRAIVVCWGSRLAVELRFESIPAAPRNTRST